MGTLFGQLKGYSIDHLKKDFISGLIVGIIAIPLGMAFAIASGVKPEYGIYTTIFAGILVSLFGGSRYQIAGPTGAFIPVLFAVVMEYGYTNLLIAGFMAGVLLLIMGLLRFGSLIKYIPRPVTIGFTSGIAIIIFSGQIANFLGLTEIEKHESFIDNMKEILIHIDQLNIYALITALISLTIILLTPRLFPRIPGPLMGLIISTIVATLLFPGKVATIGTEFGGIPDDLPQFQIPQLDFEHLQTLIKPAFIIAALGAIESLLSCVVADGMTGTRHDSNRELIGQGIANMVIPFFGGIPATGAIARTATNIKSGAVTSLSGVIHGLVVLLIVLIFAPYATHIPLASLAPILMVVAWNMSERKEFMHILKTTKSDASVLVTTFLLTVFINLTTAVEVGLVLAAFLFVKRLSDVQRVSKVLPDHSHKEKKVVPHVVHPGHDCPQVSIFTIEGPLFFGVAQLFENRIMDTIHSRPNILILKMSRVPLLDATGENNLSNIIKQFRKRGGNVLISGIQEQPLQVLKKSELFDLVGKEHFFAHTSEAIEYALQNIDREKCIGCKHFAFEECRTFSRVEQVDTAYNPKETVPSA